MGEVKWGWRRIWETEQTKQWHWHRWRFPLAWGWLKEVLLLIQRECQLFINIEKGHFSPLAEQLRLFWGWMPEVDKENIQAIHMDSYSPSSYPCKSGVQNLLKETKFISNSNKKRLGPWTHWSGWHVLYCGRQSWTLTMCLSLAWLTVLSHCNFLYEFLD